MKKGDIRVIADHYGLKSQMGMAQEECAELIQAISKWFRGTPDFNNLYEEIADVEIMVMQLKYLLKCELEVEAWQKKKVDRQMERLKKC